MNVVALKKVLKNNDRFLISTHVHADADALSCELAMARYLKSEGKKVTIVNAARPLSMFSFLPGIRSVKKPGSKKIDYDVLLVFDCGTLDRIDCVLDLVDRTKKIVNVDHHITNNYFGDINMVFPKASSTAEILFDIFKKLHFGIDSTTARLLYLGIMTDTGSFRYDSTTAHTHEVVSQLLKNKIPVHQLYRLSYENIPYRDWQLLLKIIGRFRVSHHRRVASVCLSRKERKKFSGDFDVRDKIFTYLRTLGGVDIVVIFTEINIRKTRVNFRSLGKIDVARLARIFKGGGHTNASGCCLATNMNAAQKTVLGKIGLILK